MDEEDLQEAELSRNLQTSDEFAGFGTEHDSSRQVAAIDVFRPSGQTVGVKLLARMGWKEGQGIGPRVRRAANLGDGEDDNGDEHLFAPNDVQVVSYIRKTDHKGLGYGGELEDVNSLVPRASASKSRASGLGNSSEEDTEEPNLFKAKRATKQKPKAAFGVGVLNDNGSDDDDAYSMGPRISYNRVMGGEKKAKIKPAPSTTSANPLLKSKPTFISKKLGNLRGILKKCHDGRLPLDGFVLADDLQAFSTMSIKDEKYRPQDVPLDWESSRTIEKDESGPDFVSTADAARQSTLTSKSRASLLGETQLPGKSIFDFMTPAARDRLVSASGRDNLPVARSEPAPVGYENPSSTAESLRSIIPQLEQDVALQALNRGAGGWMPYGEDESKRSRYRRYLEIQANLHQNKDGSDIPPKPDNMKREEWLLEMQEFARAAHVFKPVSGPMASRFTSSTNMPLNQELDATGSLLSRPSSKPENPAEAAAKIGMFGPLTRSNSNFYPTRLLCKRFSLPPPDHSNSTATSSGHEDSAGGMSRAVPTHSSPSAPASLQRAEAFQVAEHAPGSETVTAPVTQASQSDMAPTGVLPLMDPDRNDALEQERPGNDVFRAIFGSDDEDE